MAKYYKLTNEQLNLASAFERFQMAKFGDCLEIPESEEEGEPRNFLTPSMETKIEIEHNNLNAD